MKIRFSPIITAVRLGPRGIVRLYLVTSLQPIPVPAVAHPITGAVSPGTSQLRGRGMFRRAARISSRFDDARRRRSAQAEAIDAIRG